ncbi:hypothetical protein Hanom_Chr06g00533501 [Helianthus anomalus]
MDRRSLTLTAGPGLRLPGRVAYHRCRCCSTPPPSLPLPPPLSFSQSLFLSSRLSFSPLLHRRTTTVRWWCSDLLDQTGGGGFWLEMNRGVCVCVICSWHPPELLRLWSLATGRERGRETVFWCVLFYVLYVW